SGHQAARRLFGVVGGRQNPPLRLSAVYLIIVQRLFGAVSFSERVELHARVDRGSRQFIGRSEFRQEFDARLVNDADFANVFVSNLNQPKHLVFLRVTYRASPACGRNKPPSAIFSISFATSSPVSLPSGLYHRESQSSIPNRLKAATVASTSFNLPSSFNCRSVSRIRSR